MMRNTPPMTSTVEIPLWALLLMLAFAAIAALDKILAPSVRWFFRRRMERAVARLNRRLARPIEPFKLARRHDMIQRLTYDPKVAEAISETARAEGIPESVAFERARAYAREIVPRFSATAYFGFATRAASWLSRQLYRVRLGHFDRERLEAIDPDATVIFVINHRSNMDYVLVTFLAADRTALSYAVGEWARVWPLKPLIHAMGAYFIRRKSRNPLYRRVLARYVQMATAGGATQAIFPEGGLSLDGGLRAPRLGLLNYVVTGFDSEGARDVVFVPVSLNYDRVLEDRVLLAAGREERPRFRFSKRRMAGFVAHQFWLKMTGRFRRYGYAAVPRPLPRSSWSASARRCRWCPCRWWRRCCCARKGRWTSRISRRARPASPSRSRNAVPMCMCRATAWNMPPRRASGCSRAGISPWKRRGVIAPTRNRNRKRRWPIMRIRSPIWWRNAGIVTFRIVIKLQNSQL